MSPAAARAWRIALSMPLVTKVRFEAREGSRPAGVREDEDRRPFHRVVAAPPGGDLVGPPPEDEGAALGEHALHLVAVVVIDMSMSDGYIAAPNDNPEQGLGEDGTRLHNWAFDDSSVFERVYGNLVKETGP